MKVIAAYLLAVLGGNTSPSAEDIKDILGSVGAEADDDRIELLLSQVKGKDITELIASGREKLASVPAGGAGGCCCRCCGSRCWWCCWPLQLLRPRKRRRLKRKKNLMTIWVQFI
ncbi:hypothetical protein RJ641_008333 [Dillenia turbinata]|uniref:60S acidic ribosomal protein P2 n=1 Tax=Dillenia turbinata TaxID=194707 RepID=A0AAN8V826_9MAGN